MRLQLLILVVCFCAISTVLPAYVYEDNAAASDYSDGLDVGDLGLTTGCGYMSRWHTGSATVASSPSGHIDTSGVSFRTDNVVRRFFAPPDPSPLNILQVDLAATSSSTSVRFELFGQNASFDVASMQVFGTSTWGVFFSGSPTVLSLIPRTDPVRVQMQMDGSTSCTVKIIPLLGGATFTHSGTLDNSFASTGLIEMIFHGASGAPLYFNSIIMDNTASLPAAASCPTGVYLYEDDASHTDYADGLAPGDVGRGGSSFMFPWSPNSGTGTVAASPSGLIDTGGLAWRTTDNLNRLYTAPPVVGDIIFEVDLEVGSLASGGASCIIADGVGALAGVITSGGDWFIANTSANSGISAVDPVRLQITYNSSTSYTIKITPLLGGTPFIYNGTYFSGTGEGIYSFQINTSGGADLYFNNMVLDETGTLPVELSSFALD